MKRAQILKSEVLYEGKVFRLQRDTVIEPGGAQVERDIIEHPGSVVVLPIFNDGRILLIRQYRHSVGEFLWELVAGRKEPNESPIATKLPRRLLPSATQRNEGPSSPDLGWGKSACNRAPTRGAKIIKLMNLLLTRSPYALTKCTNKAIIVPIPKTRYHCKSPF